ncbi:MAG: lysozyme [Hyphomicrobiales bacterium]
MRNKYAPAVEDVFQGHALTEAQFGAALSFHYNTGGIRRASWAKLWKAGQIAAARKAFMNWSKPKSIIKRRKAERDLFFDGRW